MIRQAISCDVCGAEKKQTNHWFVASEQGGELRVSGWTSRNRLRAGTKHLCGQTCLHKLVDEFMARTIAGRSAAPALDTAISSNSSGDVDASLPSKAACIEAEPPAGPVAKPAVIVPLLPLLNVPVIVVQAEERPAAVQRPPLPVVHLGEAARMHEPPNYASRRWRAEAWERERERELHAVERRNESSPRHRTAF